MFTIRNFEARTLSWWFDQFEDIDFKPSYQRKGRLWTTKDKSYLIDSILNGFDMPKIYIADFTFFPSALNEHKKPYAVVDGKQRLESMFDFYMGVLTLDKDFVFLENPTLKLGGLSYKDLKANHPKAASKFENFNLSVISIITDDESLINEMFIRLNNSKPLTGAELRNAMRGDVPKLTRSIIEHSFFKEKVKFNTLRGQDANVASKLLLIEFRGKFVDTKKVNIDRLVDEVALAESGSLDNAHKEVEVVLNYMNKSFIPKDPLLTSSGLIPIYYWFYRTLGEKYFSEMRNFLLKFDSRRKNITKPTDSDIEFVKFNYITKSLNDQASLQTGFNILFESWGNWKATGKI